jgi:hypothetical protein
VIPDFSAVKKELQANEEFLVGETTYFLFVAVKRNTSKQ